jgi:hypothetical protein
MCENQKTQKDVKKWKLEFHGFKFAIEKRKTLEKFAKNLDRLL